MKKKILNTGSPNDKKLAYMAGYICRNWLDKQYYEYQEKEKFIMDNVIAVRTAAIIGGNAEWMQFINDTFNIVATHTNSCGDTFLHIETDPSYKKEIGEKIISNYDKNTLPYLLLGFFHGCRHHTKYGNIESMHFVSSQNILKQFQSLLISEFHFTPNDFEYSIDPVSGTPAYILIFSKDTAQKFLNLLPEDLIKIKNLDKNGLPKIY